MSPRRWTRFHHRMQRADFDERNITPTSSTVKKARFTQSPSRQSIFSSPCHGVSVQTCVASIPHLSRVQDLPRLHLRDTSTVLSFYPRLLSFDPGDCHFAYMFFIPCPLPPRSPGSTRFYMFHFHPWHLVQSPQRSKIPSSLLCFVLVHVLSSILFFPLSS